MRSSKITWVFVDDPDSEKRMLDFCNHERDPIQINFPFDGHYYVQSVKSYSMSYGRETTVELNQLIEIKKEIPMYPKYKVGDRGRCPARS